MSAFTVEVCTTFTADGDRDTMRAVYPAQYEYTASRQVIGYIESTEGGDIPTTVTVTPDGVDIVREGLMDLHLREGVQMTDIYDVGAASFDAVYAADRIRTSLSQSGGHVDLRYTMILGGAEMHNHVILRLKKK